jgi:LysM repeat protein
MSVKKSKKLIACTIGAGALLFAAAPVHAQDYSIKAGDTFWKIARSWNIPVQDLEAANPQADPLKLQIGQRIVIPASNSKASTPVKTAAAAQATQTYTVQGHETFWDISRKLGIPLNALMAANAHLNPYNLYDGLILKLPAAKRAVLTAAKKPAAVEAAAAGQQVRTVDGQVLRYKKSLNVKASAYSASAGENGNWGAVDYFGNALQLGTIAVDPEVIPLGSKLYITGYDHNGLPAGGMLGIASDTGGSIKGSRIDIFIPGDRNNALSFGLQDVTLYILDES